MFGSGSESATLAALVERARGTRRLVARSLTLGVGDTVDINPVVRWNGERKAKGVSWHPQMTAMIARSARNWLPRSA